MLITKFRNSVFYILIIGLFSLLIYFIVINGTDLETGRTFQQMDSGQDQWTHFIDGLKEAFKHPLALLLAQIITIIIASRSMGWLFTRFGQPEVIGETITGYPTTLVFCTYRPEDTNRFAE